MERIPLTFATTHYDHFSDLTSGRIEVDGVDLTSFEMPTEEVFFRFLTFREFDISEISMAKYASMISQGDTSITAIPVFPNRVFRHSSLYVRRDGPVKKAADLNGKRVGVPEWAETATVYARGALAHHYGVDLNSIEWTQAGVNEPGRTEKVKLMIPPGLRVVPRPDKDLSDMLVAGELDAAMCARPPKCFTEGHPNVARLFENFMEVEQQYYRETGIFPIMHAVAIQRKVVDEHPWLPMNLLKAFEESKRRSIDRILNRGITPTLDPWCNVHAAQYQALFGEDYWPYGIEANHKTLDAFLLYAYEHGVCHRRVEVEELFAKQVLQHVRV